MDFFGPSRVVETIYGDITTSSALVATQMNNLRTHSAVQPAVSLPDWGDVSSDQLGYDGTGRMITKRYLTGGLSSVTNGYANTASLAGFTTAYDRASNKLYERHLHAESRSHLYQPFNIDGSFGVGYDSANRLRQYQRGILSPDIIPYRMNAGSSISIPTTLPGADQVRTYDLDGLGNWKQTNYDLVGSGGSITSTAEVRQHNYVNQITSTKDNAAPATPYSYDKNGNLLNDGVRTYFYDGLNRLVQVNKITGPTTAVTLAAYGYDALGRRVLKVVEDLGGGLGGLTGDIPSGTTYYLYDGQQSIQENFISTDESRTYSHYNVWGQYIDELLFIATENEGTYSSTYRVLSDLLYRSVALVTTSNVITEAYDCDAYGNTLCYSGPGTDGHWFTDDDVRTNNPINVTIFTGRQFDMESLIYYYRARYYSPNIGRFISRDPLKDAELSQGSNLYYYVGNNPINLVDPFGFAKCPCCLDEAKAVLAAAQIFASGASVNQALTDSDGAEEVKNESAKELLYILVEEIEGAGNALTLVGKGLGIGSAANHASEANNVANAITAYYNCVKIWDKVNPGGCDHEPGTAIINNAIELLKKAQ